MCVAADSPSPSVVGTVQVCPSCWSDYDQIVLVFTVFDRGFFFGGGGYPGLHTICQCGHI